MTIVSNVLAFGIMPLNIWLYCRSWTSEEFQVPYTQIMISLVMTVGPAAVGILVRWKWEKVSHYVIKVSLAQSFILLHVRYMRYIIISSGTTNMCL